MNPDRYLDSREFLPSEMEKRVRAALEEREGKAPEKLSDSELETKWELLNYKEKTRKLKTCRAVLAAACFLLTVGLAAAVFHPVNVQGNNTYVSFITADGTEEQFVFQYKELESSYGRTHKYRSFEELETALGFLFVKPAGQKIDGLYLDARPKSGLYNVTAYFGKEKTAAIAGYNAYFVKDEENAYSYTHTISQDWKKTGSEELGGRKMTLYEVNRTTAGKKIYGAAFSEDGILYVLYSSSDTSLETFKTALGALTK